MKTEPIEDPFVKPHWGRLGYDKKRVSIKWYKINGELRHTISVPGVSFKTLCKFPTASSNIFVSDAHLKWVASL